MPKTIARHRKGRDSYLELVTEVSLVRIRSAAQYDAAVDMVRKLSVRGEENLDPGAREYLEMLLLSVGEYEDRRHRVELSGLTPVGVLKHLMAANHMKGRDLAEILGSKMENGTVTRVPLNLAEGSYHSWPNAEAVRKFRAKGRRLWS